MGDGPSSCRPSDVAQDVAASAFFASWSSSPQPGRQVTGGLGVVVRRLAGRPASARARSAVPLTAAQSSASQRSTSGSAGLAGGFLPVAAFQALVRLFFATVAPNSAATSERIDQTFELSFVLRLVLGHVLPFGDALRIRGVAWVSLVSHPSQSRGAACGRGRGQRPGCRVETSQYGVAVGRVLDGAPSPTASGRDGSAGRRGRRRPRRAPAGSRSASSGSAGPSRSSGDVGRAGVQRPVAHGDPRAAEPREQRRR